MENDNIELVGNVRDSYVEFNNDTEVGTKRQAYMEELKALMIRHGIRKIDVAMCPTDYR